MEGFDSEDGINEIIGGIVGGIIDCGCDNGMRDVVDRSILSIGDRMTKVPIVCFKVNWSV